MRIPEQIRATRPDRSVLLTASAGSGKTYVLVRRIIHLLAAGASPEELAAITFTEKAAAQMKDNLYATLAREAAKGTGAAGLLELEINDAPYPLKNSPEDIYSALTARPDTLKISTIHAFCLGILRQFPLEAGLPANFSVMETSEIPIRRDRAAARCIDEAVGGRLDADFWTLFEAGFTVYRLKDLLAGTLEKRSLLSMLEADAGSMDALTAALDSMLGRQEMEAALAEPGRWDALRAGAATLAGFVEDYAPWLDDYAAGLRRLSRVEGPADTGVMGASVSIFYTDAFELRKKLQLTKKALKESLGGALKGKALDKRVGELAARHEELFNDLRGSFAGVAELIDDIAAARALSSFLRMYKLADTLYSERNHSEGLVDFDDLEVHAYRLLSGPDALNVMYRMESKVVHYLVDEFQDTSLMQWGILSRLNSEVFAGEGAQGIKAPTLFCVGDAKQSIYRFRSAEYRLMERLKGKMEEAVAEGRRDFPELRENFRSAPEILDVVDETFGSIFKSGYSNSEPFRKNAKGSVTLRVAEKDDEAQVLAGMVQSAAGLPVHDGGSGEIRPASYGDMAVLLRTRTGLKEYEEALMERGIPFKVVGGVGFFHQDEVRAVLGILSFLENASELTGLATALRSPIFRLSDGEIEPLFFSPGPDGSGGSPLDALRDISPEAHGLIGNWSGMVGLVPPGELVERIVTDSAALFAFGLSYGPSAALNLEKLVGIAREFDRTGGAGLSEFTAWVAAYREKADLATADVELPEYDDFVRIMTVHAAKGLEFPVVFVPGMSKRPRGGADAFLAGAPDGPGMTLRTAALLGEPPSYKRAKDAEKAEDAREAARLLYVAMTRAKDHLFMLAGPGERSPGEDSTAWFDMLVDASPKSLFGDAPPDKKSPAAYRYPESGPRRLEAGRGKAPLMKPVEDADEFLKRIKPLSAGNETRFVRPSSLAKLPEGMQKPGDAGTMLRGLVIHAMLERCGKSGGYSKEAAQSAANTVPGMAKLGAKAREALVAGADDTVRSLLENDGVRKLLFSRGEIYFELPLMMKDGDAVITGTADFVRLDGDTVTVVDYKSGYAGVDTEAVKQAYAGQLEAYTKAAAAAFCAKQARAYLILVDTAEVVEMKAVDGGPRPPG